MFRIDEEKAVEAIVYIANKKPGITEFYLAKVLFYAEKMHMNLAGRPIIADTFIAMPNGPVPSNIRNYFHDGFENSALEYNPEEAFRVEKNRYTEIFPNRKSNLEVFSKSDLKCLDEAFEKYSNIPFGILSDLTHNEKAWAQAPQNSPMDYLDFIDDNNPNKQMLIEQINEYNGANLL